MQRIAVLNDRRHGLVALLTLVVSDVA